MATLSWLILFDRIQNNVERFWLSWGSNLHLSVTLDPETTSKNSSQPMKPEIKNNCWKYDGPVLKRGYINFIKNFWEKLNEN